MASEPIDRQLMQQIVDCLRRFDDARPATQHDRQLRSSVTALIEAAARGDPNGQVRADRRKPDKPAPAD
jgi:hypothetical protein